MTCVAHDEPGRRRCDACVDYSAWRPRLACRVCGAANHCGECCENCLHKCNGGQMCSVGQPYNQLIARAEAMEIKLTEQEEHMGEASRLDMDYLVSNPASDANFKYVLERASEETIRGALQEIGDNHRKAAVVKALQGQLKKLLETEGEQVAATEARQARAVTMDMITLQAERDQQQALQAEQNDREARIAESYEIAGRIQAMTFVEKVLTVSTLVQLKRIKESKAYRDLPSIGTWDKYCDYLGFSRQKVDADLQNLAEFGEQFLLTVGSFGLGYREMRQLRQLKYDGESFQMSEDGKTVVIEGEVIALGDDAAPEIEAALEKLLEKNKSLRERNTKLEKDLKGAVKEEVAGLAAEKTALVQRVKELEQYEPTSMDETRFEEQYREIMEQMASLATKISRLMKMDNLAENPVLAARVEGYVASVGGLSDNLREEWSAQFQIY